MADDNVFSLEEFLRNPVSLGRRAAPTPAPEPVMQEYIPRLPAPLYSPMSQPMGMLNALSNVSPIMSPVPVQVPFLPGQQPGARQTPQHSPVRAGQGVNLSLDDITNIVRAGESSGNYTALNREKKGNTASGAYQYTDRTWNGYGGYAKAMLAPKEVQDRRFAEDIARRHSKYGGDIFKIIAEHYLPAAANNPSVWQQPYKLQSGQTVRPVATYIRHIISKAKNPDLERAFDEYLSQY